MCVPCVEVIMWGHLCFEHVNVQVLKLVSVKTWICVFIYMWVCICIYVSMFMCVNQGMSKLVCVKVLMYFSLLQLNVQARLYTWAWCTILSEAVSVCGCACAHEFICEQVHVSEFINMLISVCLCIYVFICSWVSKWVYVCDWIWLCTLMSNFPLCK